MSISITLNTSKIVRRSEAILVLSRDSRLNGTPLEGYSGFGTPRVVRHPDTREPWLLFTAWKDVNGKEREVWAAPIKDEYELELDLAKAKKIAVGSDAGVTGLASVDAFFDYINEEWLIFATIYGGDQSNVAVIIADKDFNKKSVSLVSTGVDLSDGGFPVDGFEDDLALIATTAAGNAMFKVADFSARPLSISKIADMIYGPVGSMDVHKTFICNGRLWSLTEALDYNGVWHIMVHIGPYRAWKAVGSNENLGKFMFVVSEKSFVPYSSPWEKTSYGHPEYAAALKRSAVMWTSFRHCHWPGVNQGLKWSHEIWAMHVDPYIFADPRIWLPAFLVITPDIASARNGNIVIDCAGASKVVLYAYKHTSSYTVYVRGSNDINHLANEDGYYYEESWSIGSGPSKYVIDPAPPTLALKISDTSVLGEITIRLIP